MKVREFKRELTFLFFVQHLGIINKLAISHNPAYDEGMY